MYKDLCECGGKLFGAANVDARESFQMKHVLSVGIIAAFSALRNLQMILQKQMHRNENSSNSIS
jgi:hypothetical protein